VLVAGALGGLVSSTAVLFANARSAASGHGSQRVLAAGGALATAVSFVRVAAIIAALNPALLPIAGPPLLLAALAALGFCAIGVGWRRASGTQPMIAFRNPFSLLAVIAMAASMGVVMLIGRVISERFGASGATATAAITGLFDVDAMTVSMARLSPDVLSTQIAALAILVGVASATLGKIAIAAIIGRGRFALTVGLMSLICVAAGAVAWWVSAGLVN
jgi:uncharacterized membrane protein (DUF4010 family)